MLPQLEDVHKGRLKMLNSVQGGGHNTPYVQPAGPVPRKFLEPATAHRSVLESGLMNRKVGLNLFSTLGLGSVGGLQLIVDSQSAHRRSRSCLNAQYFGQLARELVVIANEESLVFGKGQTPVKCEVLVRTGKDVIQLSDGIILAVRHDGHAQVVHMQAYGDVRVAILHGMYGWSKKTPELKGGESATCGDAPGGPNRIRDEPIIVDAS